MHSGALRIYPFSSARTQRLQQTAKRGSSEIERHGQIEGQTRRPRGNRRSDHRDLLLFPPPLAGRGSCSRSTRQTSAARRSRKTWLTIPSRAHAPRKAPIVRRSPPPSLSFAPHTLLHRSLNRLLLRAPLAHDGHRCRRSCRARSRARCGVQSRSAGAGQEGRGAATGSIVRAHARSKGGCVDGRSNVGSKYQVMDVIGEGAVRRVRRQHRLTRQYGVVCSAIHRPSGTKVAIKKVR